MSFAIRVDNLGKRYRLGATHAGSIRELVNRSWRRLRGHREQLLPHEHAELQSMVGGKLEEDGSFWALRDVSFEVQPGEVVGIIGRNGSGKSTLLKILSQITAPTTGRVELNGRVASLLEVGTGFHPELSGRENVFLNGAILGMTKTEIRRKFDEIVAFAEIEKFIDTPVKRYSSGMYVRLAFAVAAHLEPEILVIDEVLAVGDSAFQKKCLGKMDQVAHKGRTILFVSHNMAAVRQLCRRSVVLTHGERSFIGKVDPAIDHYMKNEEHYSETTQFMLNHRDSDLTLVEAGVSPSVIRFGESLLIRAIWEARRERQVAFEFILRDQLGVPLAFFGTGISAGFETMLPTGRTEIFARYPGLPLAEGWYSVDIVAAQSGQRFFVYAEKAVFFEVAESDPLRTGRRYVQGNGSVFLPCEVTTNLPALKTSL